jgi:hypothetical protein
MLAGTESVEAGSGAPSGSGSGSLVFARSGPIAGSIAANPAVAAIPTAHRARRAGCALRRSRTRPLPDSRLAVADAAIVVVAAVVVAGASLATT